MNIENLLYYSTNTYLSFLINETFYSGKHFIWCSPVFDAEALDKFNILKNIPPSSNPSRIYVNLKEDVDKEDLHSSKIDANKRGIKMGASIMFDKGEISENEFGIINSIVEKSSIQQFRPVLYIMPKHIIQDKLELVDVDEKANPLSIEFRIADLKTNEFELIEY